MNPSSTGWIHKYIHVYTKTQVMTGLLSNASFYNKLKRTGFIYGVSVTTLMDEPISNLKLTKDEYTKVNLFHALLFAFFQTSPNSSYEEAVQSMLLFYKTAERGKSSFFKKLSFTTSPSESLEKIISNRLQEQNTSIKTEAASLLTHALLYIDVLAYIHYLKNPESLKTYLNTIETIIIESSVLALDAKKEKNKYDLLVLDLVASSVQFSTEDIKASFSAEISEEEKQYLLDVCCLAVWDDRELDTSEMTFLKELNKHLGFSDLHLQKNLQELIGFSEVNKKKILLFEYTHPVKQFYKQSSKTVKLLILRNKNRLLKELNESGELLLLLSQSTQRELSKDEKAKVKEQLLDIFKSIPSLAIFMLPGGAILLPLFVKLIPKLLPSAFNENRVDRD